VKRITPPTGGELERAAQARFKAQRDGVMPPEIMGLRSLPIDQRAEALVSMFRFVASEWAVMVLENVKPAKAKPKRRKR
jgi:hypothetical protein